MMSGHSDTPIRVRSCFDQVGIIMNKRCEQSVGSYSCVCRTTSRRLALIKRDLVSLLREIGSWADRFQWRSHLDGAVMEIPIGGDSPWATLGEFVGFLKSLFDEKELVDAKVAWLHGGSTEAVTFAMLFDAVPLLECVEEGASPIEQILRERRIETWFQPIFERSNHRIWGYECLARGRDSEGEIVPPIDMIRWCEQENLLFMFDRVCRETHLTNAGRADVPHDATFLINFLPTAIYDPNYCLRTSMAAARNAGLDPSRVIFEVVESHAVAERDHLRRTLDYYRSHGFRVALDDVSAGFSGLSMLADLEPDIIKIDRALVVRSVESDAHRHVCIALKEIAHKSDKLVLAEGIDSEAQLACMRDIGVDLFQGFLLARPDPVPAHSCAISSST